jgi:hypothetical protein
MSPQKIKFDELGGPPCRKGNKRNIGDVYIAIQLLRMEIKLPHMESLAFTGFCLRK